MKMTKSEAITVVITSAVISVFFLFFFAFTSVSPSCQSEGFVNVVFSLSSFGQVCYSYFLDQLQFFAFFSLIMFVVLIGSLSWFFNQNITKTIVEGEKK